MLMTMLKGKKKFTPFVFFIGMTLFWSYYYLSSNGFNGHGASKFEYLFLIDGLIVLPILCWVCIEKRNEALLKILTYSCLVILIGSYIIPEENQRVWNHLENGRYLILALFIVFEIVAVISVLFAIKTQVYQGDDPDITISTAIEKFLGKTLVSQLICLETRMWTYLLFYKKITVEQFSGHIHFSYHNKDGAESYIQGFAWIMVFELLPVHLLIHYMASPTVANIITALTLFSILWMLSESRAMTLRPISLTATHLAIRYGLREPLYIPLSQIQSIDFYQELELADIKNTVKTLNYVGEPNILLYLKTPYKNHQAFAIGIDKPHVVINEIEARLNQVCP